MTAPLWLGALVIARARDLGRLAGDADVRAMDLVAASPLAGAARIGPRKAGLVAVAVALDRGTRGRLGLRRRHRRRLLRRSRRRRARDQNGTCANDRPHLFNPSAAPRTARPNIA